MMLAVGYAAMAQASAADADVIFYHGQLTIIVPGGKGKPT